MRLLGNKLAILFLLFTMCGKPPLQLLWRIGIRESKHAKSVYMGDTLDLLKQVCRRWIWLPVLLIFCCSGAALRAQDNASAGFTADEVIQILQENPDLLGEAKTQIAAALQERGYPATERDISDDRLFSTIQSDDRARKLLSDELLKRGFVPASAEQSPAQPAATTPSAVSPQKQPTSNTTAGAGDQPASMASGRKPREPGAKSRGALQSQYPYRNLPALHDLYTQSPTDDHPLERFGAALFRNSAAAADKVSLDVPVGPDYVLGPGDDLIVEYWGSSSQRVQLTVNREGRILLPEAGALMVAGHTLADAQDLVRKSLLHQLKGISVDVSLAKLRTVRIFVVGDVKNPGAYDISSLSTPLSALLLAGGPTDAGSLRTVKHFRRRQLVEEVDLYDLMLKGLSSSENLLQSGDSILVPPAGAQVTVAGMVRRPAIYELRNEQTLDQVLDLAGGVTVFGELGRIRVERIEAHERREMLSVSLPGGSDAKTMEDGFRRFSVKDGDAVTISSILPYSNQAVYLQGHVFRPGKYAYKEGIKVTDLIGSFADLLPEPADRAEIVRLHPPNYSPLVIGFNLRDVFEKRAEAPVLQMFDTLRVFGRYEADAPKVSIYGEVLRPGEYPLSERMTAAELLRLAGGFKRSAYAGSADLASYDVVNGERVELEHRKIPIAKALAGESDTDVVLKPGDVLTISQLGGWTDIGGSVTVAGEVLHPGRYGIQHGDRLSSILKRAGGFLPDAYPYGAVLQRAQVKEAAVKNRDELIRRLQEQGLQGDSISRTESPLVARQRQQLIDKLKQIEPSGRLLIRITSRVEKWENTPLDVELRPGDSLLIPKTPNFILVAGQVYNPAAMTYTPGRHAGWYLKQAGGPTSAANKQDIFVVRANGSVVGRGSNGWWSGSVTGALLQPGDTIYVPEKVSGSGIFKNFGQTAQILSGLAVAARVITTL